MITEPKPQTPLRRGSRWPVWLAVVAVVAVIAWIYFSSHRSPGAGSAGGRGGMRTMTVPVLAGTVSRADMPVSLTAIGTVEAAESVSVRSQASGQILSVGFAEGRPVTKGQVLFQLDPAPLKAALAQAEATLARDRAQLAQARADERRFQSLLSQGFVSRQQAEQASASASALAATVQADLAQVEAARVQLGFATIRAPISGVAGERLVDAGNIVRAGDTNALVVINRVSPVLVGFSIPQDQIDRVRRFQRQAPIPVTATPRGGTPQTGSVVFIDNAVDSTTGTLKLQARFANANQALVPGQFVDVAMTLTVEKDRVVVPTQAVLPSQDGHLVFVINEDSTVSQRPVKVERTAGERTVIESGLSPGERVVTDGTLQLKDGSKIEIRQDLIPPSPKARGGRSH